MQARVEIKGTKFEVWNRGLLAATFKIASAAYIKRDQLNIAPQSGIPGASL